MEFIYVIIETRDFSLPYCPDEVTVPICWVRTEKEAEDKIWELSEAERSKVRPKLRPNLSWDWEAVPKG